MGYVGRMSDVEWESLFITVVIAAFVLVISRWALRRK